MKTPLAIYYTRELTRSNALCYTSVFDCVRCYHHSRWSFKIARLPDFCGRLVGYGEDPDVEESQGAGWPFICIICKPACEYD